VLVEVVVWTLALDQKTHAPVVILKDVSGERKLPIWIGQPEASAIATELANRKFPRPLTHDLLNSVIRGLGGKVQRVEISDLIDNTFYAKIYVDSGNGVLCIDARPSDSIALALKARARIYVDPKLFPAEIDALLAETSKAADGDDEQRSEELKEFIEKLDPRDFGKFRF
jgi:bifunctional DNase/RNase